LEGEKIPPIKNSSERRDGMLFGGIGTAIFSRADAGGESEGAAKLVECDFCVHKSFRKKPFQKSWGGPCG
jgi:hypothetical protein